MAHPQSGPSISWMMRGFRFSQDVQDPAHADKLKAFLNAPFATRLKFRRRPAEEVDFQDASLTWLHLIARGEIDEAHGHFEVFRAEEVVVGPVTPTDRDAFAALGS